MKRILLGSAAEWMRNLPEPEPNRTRINADGRGSKHKELTDAILCCFYVLVPKLQLGNADVYKAPALYVFEGHAIFTLSSLKLELHPQACSQAGAWEHEKNRKQLIGLGVNKEVDPRTTVLIFQVCSVFVKSEVVKD